MIHANNHDTVVIETNNVLYFQKHIIVTIKMGSVEVKMMFIDKLEETVCRHLDNDIC